MSVGDVIGATVMLLALASIVGGVIAGLWMERTPRSQKRRRNNWRLTPGGRLTFWRGSRADGMPASFVWLGRRKWIALNLGHRTGWRPFDCEVSQFGPFEIETWPTHEGTTQ